MTFKKYNSIERHGKRGTHLTVEGDPYVVIMEKIDGANASFRRVGNEILCFSRNTQLDEENGLRGFYQWAQESININSIDEDTIFYGEWSAKHKLDYGDNHNKFYLFDVYDEAVGEYMPLGVVREYAKQLEIELAHIFYEGEFQSIEHVKSFVGKSVLGEVGEGVVVKNYDYKDRFGSQQFTKFVSDEFAEASKVKTHKVSDNVDPLTGFINATLTEARVSKLIHKLVDEGHLEEEYGIEDMGTILKGLGSSVFEDIIKEELDSLLKVVKGKVGKSVPNVVKQVLVAEGKV